MNVRSSTRASAVGTTRREIFVDHPQSEHMRVLGVAGPSDSGKTTAVAALTTRLRDRGSVATVKHLTHEPDVDTEGKDTDRHRAAGAEHTVGITEEGGWFATGDDRTLDAVLDDLTPHVDYVLVEGFSGRHLPTVVLGGRETAPPVVAEASCADDLDYERVLDRIETIPPTETPRSLAAAVRTVADEPSMPVATGEAPISLERAATAPSEQLNAHASSVEQSLRAEDGVRVVRVHHRRPIDPTAPTSVCVAVATDTGRLAAEAVADALEQFDDRLHNSDERGDASTR